MRQSGRPRSSINGWPLNNPTMRILSSDVEHLTASDENTDLAGCHDRERPLLDGHCVVQRVDKDFLFGAY